MSFNYSSEIAIYEKDFNNTFYCKYNFHLADVGCNPSIRVKIKELMMQEYFVTQGEVVKELPWQYALHGGLAINDYVHEITLDFLKNSMIQLENPTEESFINACNQWLMDRRTRLKAEAQYLPLEVPHPILDRTNNVK